MSRRRAPVCSIFGFTDAPYLQLFRGMSARLAHRGPGRRKEFMDASILWCCCRLPVRDLSREADQPFADSQGRIILVIGELFKLRALCKRLSSLGHRFLPYLLDMRGFSVAELPVGHRPRHHGKSKLGFPRLLDGVRVLAMRYGAQKAPQTWPDAPGNHRTGSPIVRRA